MRELLLWLNLNNLSLNKYPAIERLCGSLEDFFDASIRKDLKKALSPSQYKKMLEDYSIEQAREKISSLLELFNVVTVEDEDYPEKLRFIEDCPRVLYYEGDFSLVKGNLLAMVGARKCTAYASWAVEHIMKELSQYDMTVVSGVALGVDALSHNCAIKNGMKTIGVLGTGIDLEYPSANRKLFCEMRKNHLLLTEFPPGLAGYPQNFPQRNRIISGLSSAVAVIEAKEKSGSLITASAAFEQGRDVFALPGRIDSLYSKGTNSLIYDGACPLLGAKDIIEGVSDFKKLKKRSDSGKSFETKYTPEQKKILERLSEGFAFIDELAESLDLSVSSVGAMLTVLEMQGVVKELSGNRFALV